MDGWIGRKDHTPKLLRLLEHLRFLKNLNQNSNKIKYAWYFIPWLQSLICKYAPSERMILISFENCRSPLILIGKANIENVNIACLSTSLWLLKMSTVSRCHHHSDNWNCQHIVLVVIINITTGIINITRISLLLISSTLPLSSILKMSTSLGCQLNFGE